MAELAFAPLFKGADVEVSNLEEGLNHPAYTVDTVDSSQFSNRKIGLLLGFDHLKTFSEWKEPLSLIQKVDLLFVSRPDFLTRSFEDELTQLALRLKIQEPQKISDQAEIYKWRHCEHLIYRLESGKGPSFAQARLIRAEYAKGEKSDQKWVPQEVARYIREKKLYKNMSNLRCE